MASTTATPGRSRQATKARALPDPDPVAAPTLELLLPNDALPLRVADEREPGGTRYLTIHESMGCIVAEMPAIGKNQRNKAQGFMFRGIDDVLNALNPLLGKYGVYYMPVVLERTEGTRTTKGGESMYVVNLHVRYTFYGPSGDSVTASAWGEGTDMGDKSTPKAMTNAQKNCLFQAFCISTSEQTSNDSDRTTPDDTMDVDASAREQGWNDDADRQDAHRMCNAAIRDAFNAGKLTDAQAAELRDWRDSVGWPMSKDNMATLSHKLLEMMTETIQANEARAAQDQEQQQEFGGDDTGSTVDANASPGEQ